MSIVMEVREGGGGGGRGIRGILRRATSHRERLSDFDVTRAKTLVQTRIDTDPWASKGKSAKEAIGQAWSKWFHVLGIPDRNVTIHILFQRLNKLINEVSEYLCISMLMVHIIMSSNSVAFQVRAPLLHRDETLMTST
jgi:hypothetical protein